jgi:hypothetical protein
MKDQISFSQMLAEMELSDLKGNPVKFSLIFVTADLKRGTGGDIYIFGRRTTFVDMFRRQHKDSIFTESQVIKTAGKHNGQPLKNSQASGTPKMKKDPRHYDHKTINVMLLTSKQVRKVHPDLILYFNEKKVIQN